MATPLSRSFIAAADLAVLYYMLLYCMLLYFVILYSSVANPTHHATAMRVGFQTFSRWPEVFLYLSVVFITLERYTYAYMNVYYGNNNIVYYYEEPRWSVVAVKKLPFRFHRLYYYICIQVMKWKYYISRSSSSYDLRHRHLCSCRRINNSRIILLFRVLSVVSLRLENKIIDFYDGQDPRYFNDS